MRKRGNATLANVRRAPRSRLLKGRDDVFAEFARSKGASDSWLLPQIRHGPGGHGTKALRNRLSGNRNTCALG